MTIKFRPGISSAHICLITAADGHVPLKLNSLGYFEKHGLNVLVFSNWYDGNFSDAKISGVELIHRGVRTATNGDVRMKSTPAQWDAIPRLVHRKVDKEKGRIEVSLAYPELDIQYVVSAEAKDEGVLLGVHLAKPLPGRFEGKAGFNLEFLPSAYFRKTYLVDGRGGVFPLHPGGTMDTASGPGSPKPISAGRTFVLAPEDPERRVTVRALEGEILLFDGRHNAQNGWYVLRSLLPPGRSGKVVEWFLTASTEPDWVRPPVIAHSQVGYHPAQKKTAVIELDLNDTTGSKAKLSKIHENGGRTEVHSGRPEDWGVYLRYRYRIFDFSAVREAGLYEIEYGGVRTRPFRIASDVYDKAWQPTLDVFLPVQMDHMSVREAYRVWHGVPHLDDALQAPPGHRHFDMYAQGDSTDTRFKAGEHIPGLNAGGWFDAGDYDIRTQTQYATVLALVHTWEAFGRETCGRETFGRETCGLRRDETSVDWIRRSVVLHQPDGEPDLLGQIKHGTKALLAQHEAVGHAISGIIESSLDRYTHLGDASTKTDNLMFNPGLAPGESDGFTSGNPDDRWAFTTKSTSLNYGSAAALAAASRALSGTDFEFKCLSMAEKVWKEEHAHPPDIFVYGNTTGGPLETEELKAAVELLMATRDSCYSDRIDSLWPAIDKYFMFNAAAAVRAMPFMNDAYAAKLRVKVKEYGEQLSSLKKQNPFGVPISMGGWGGNGLVIQWAATNYFLHKAFPDLVDVESVFAGLNYIYGSHPGSDLSFVSGVGTVSKEVAYGSNRADFSFIPGGVVPGMLIVKPDFPENKEDWPFLWGENEYVTGTCAAYFFLVHAAIDLLKEETNP